MCGMALNNFYMKILLINIFCLFAISSFGQLVCATTEKQDYSDLIKYAHIKLNEGVDLKDTISIEKTNKIVLEYLNVGIKYSNILEARNLEPGKSTDHILDSLCEVNNIKRLYFVDQ